MFGIDDEIIAKALKNGILIEANGEYVKNTGPVSLAYYPLLRRFVLCFGTSAQNASFVLVEDYTKTWQLID